MFIHGALRGVEASFLAEAGLRKLRAAVVWVAWSRRQSLANPVVWFQFRMLRRFLAYRPGEVARVYRLLEHANDGCPGHGPAHLNVESAAEIGFVWSREMVGWAREGCRYPATWPVPFSTSGRAILKGWREKVSADLCARRGFRGVLGWI